MPFDLTIVAPDGERYREAVESVVLPGSEGEFGVLIGHERFLTPLKAGRIEVQPMSGNRAVAEIGVGFADVRGDQVAIMVETCEFEGDSLERYYRDKRAGYPPDIEREQGKTYRYRV